MKNKHLAIGANVQKWSATFDGQKTKTIVFDKPFEIIPQITFSQDAVTFSVPYRTLVTIFGFQLSFKTNVSLTVSGEANAI